MTTRNLTSNGPESLNEDLALLEEHVADEVSAPLPLKRACSDGLRDLENGRFVEVSHDCLGPMMADIGRRVAESLSEK
jgi:hypothetical protein